MRSLFYTNVPCLVSVSLLLVIAACGGDDRPPAASNGTTNVPSSSGAAPPADAAVDGGLDAVDASDSGDAAGEEVIGPALCAGLVQLSDLVAEHGVITTPMTAAGGSIVPGTYVLNEMSELIGNDPNDPDPPPPGPTGRVARVTLIVGNKTIRVLEARGTDPGTLPNDSASATTYEIKGTTLERTDVCPTAGGAAKAMSFTATANLLTFHVDGEHFESFRFVR